MPLSEDADRPIDGVAFGDAAEIEFDARFVERDRLVDRIQHDVRGSDVAPGSVELHVGRHVAFASEESPRFHQRADRDVERAAGLAVVAHRLRDEVEEFRIDGHGMLRSFAIDAREWALGFVVAHQPIDAVHFVERLVGDARQRRGIRAVSVDGIHASH